MKKYHFNMTDKILTTFTGFEFIQEHKFHPIRKWRFDFANIETKTAIEQEGGVFIQGRHTRGKGFLNDMEKYNTAIELGWVVLRYTPDQLKKTVTLEQIREVLKQRLFPNPV
jgi:very-short-patch-repair endonuclease